MKKVFILFAAIVFAATSFSQTIGGKAGVNFCSQSFSEGDDFPSGGELPDNGSGIGFHIGGFAQIEINESLNFRPELLFTLRAVSEDINESFEILGSSVVTTGESKAKSSYLSLPLLAEYKASDAFAAQLGPVISFLMGSSSDFEGETTSTFGGMSTTETFSESSSSTDGLNSIELGLGVGATYTLESGLHFGARYNLGISSINEENDALKAKWGVAQISVGYAFLKP
jgi:hypothetical protein